MYINCRLFPIVYSLVAIAYMCGLPFASGGWRCNGPSHAALQLQLAPYRQADFGEHGGQIAKDISNYIYKCVWFVFVCLFLFILVDWVGSVVNVRHRSQTWFWCFLLLADFCFGQQPVLNVCELGAKSRRMEAYGCVKMRDGCIPLWTRTDAYGCIRMQLQLAPN